MRDHDPSLCDCLVLEVVGLEWDTAWVVDDPDAPDDLFDTPDTEPLGFTVIGPLLQPKAPARLPAERVDAAAVPLGLKRAAR